MMTRIPNQFHFVYGLRRQKRPFHLIHYLCLESCLQVNQPSRIYFYYYFQPYGRYWDLVKDRLTLMQVEPNAIVSNFKYKDGKVAKYKYAHHADFIRLEQLFDRGGVYADIDTIFVNPIPSSLFQSKCVLGEEPQQYDPRTQSVRPFLGNALIMSEPRGQFIRMWLTELPRSFDGTWGNHSIVLPWELMERNPTSIHVEPVRSFYNYGPTHEGIETLFQRLESDFNGILSMHLWGHLWWSRWRRDFTSFHAGQVTERYIRRVDTTYNVVARRFLPPGHRKVWFLSPRRNV